MRLRQRHSPLVCAITAHVDGAVQVRVRGEIDMSTSKKFGDVLTRAMAETTGRVEVDLSGVTFMDSQGIRTLLAALSPSTNRLVVTAASVEVRRLLRVTGLESLLMPDSE